MPLYTHNKFPLSRLKIVSVAVSLALVLPVAHAANFGKLTVLSSLGQPLRAEIELTAVSKDEEGKLVARLATGEAFRKANIDVNPVLSSLRFSVEQRQGRQFIRIVSGQPINEPFVDMLLELYSASSRQFREYTFLLDPPDTRKPQTAQATPAPLLPPVRSVASEPKPTAAKATAPATAAMPVATSATAPAITPAVVAADTAEAAPAPVTPAAPVATIADEEPVPRIVAKDEPSKLAEDLIRDGRSEQSDATNAPVPDAVAAKLASPEAAAKAAEAAPVVAKGRRVKDASVAAKAEAEGGKSYRVKDGDTLAEIASRNKENTVSLDQMLVALYRANPEAFIGDNMNRLRAGRVLSVPDAATAEALDKGEARSTVVAQAQDFNTYRNKLAGQVASGAARKASESKQSGSGKVTARVEEKSSSGEAKDKLQLSKAGAAADKAAAEKAAAEDKIAADKAIAEANERVKELEKNVSDLQKLLEIKNKTLAEMSEQQKAAVAKQEPAAPATPPAVAEVAKAEPAAVAAAPETLATELKAEAPAEKPKAAPSMTQVPAKIAKPGFFDHIQDNPFALPAGGLLVALLAGLGFVRLRNKQKPAASDKPAKKTKPVKEDEPVVEPVMPTLEAAVPVAAVAEPVMQPAPTPVPVEPEPVDPIAEANMYITYGRDEQAEDILRLALRTEPNRQAIRLKLLEIYAKRQDVEAFNDTAGELHVATGGVGAEWADAVAMGILLDPTNPLYGGSPAEETVLDMLPELEEELVPEPVAEPEPAPQEADLEFDLNDFKAAEVQPAAAADADIGSKIDFDLELDGEAAADTKAGVDADSEEATPTVSTAVPPPPVPIELDLPEPAEPPPVDPLEDEESAFAAEMSTKLDLAAAYQEIGDREGARELLDEVIRGGSDAQIERAKDMLAKL